MHSTRVSPLVIAAALSACATESESLNSERISERFGNYGIEVLSHEGGIRRSTLYSTQEGLRICRTYAVVRFIDDSALAVADAHAEVLAGQSIGATFKASDWQLAKLTLHIGSLSLPGPEHPIARLMHVDAPAELSVHAYRLLLVKGSETISYATIVEVHHPDYLTVDELTDLYGEGIEATLPAKEVERLSQLVLAEDEKGLSP